MGVLAELSHGRIAVLGLAAVLAGLTIAPAEAAGNHTVVVNGSLRAVTDATPDMTLCTAQGGEYIPGPHDVAYSGTSVYHGTFEGTGRFCGHSLPTINPDGSAPFVETDTFTGTVRGCGEGSVSYNVHGVINSSVAPTAFAVAAKEDWKIVARSGSGGLRGLKSGSGHDDAVINPDTSIDADFKGTVTCTPLAAPHPVVTVARKVSGSGITGPCAGPSRRFYDPLTGRFECDGFARLEGGWTGTGRFHAVGTINPITGNASGTFDEVLDVTLADQRSGQIHLIGRISLDGNTGAETVQAEFFGGTGVFASARGSATYNAFAPISGGPSTGTYSASWGSA